MRAAEFIIASVPALHAHCTVSACISLLQFRVPSALVAPPDHAYVPSSPRPSQPPRPVVPASIPSPSAILKRATRLTTPPMLTNSERLAALLPRRRRRPVQQQLRVVQQLQAARHHLRAHHQRAPHRAR